MIRLPWPPKDLNPNSRKDRRKSGGVRKTYRTACWVLTKQAKPAVSDHLKIRFCPPDGRKRDLDNMLASIKSGLDGVSQAVGRDDSHWALTIEKGAPERPDGAVYIEFVEAAE